MYVRMILSILEIGTFIREVEILKLFHFQVIFKKRLNLSLRASLQRSA